MCSRGNGTTSQNIKPQTTGIQYFYQEYWTEYCQKSGLLMPPNANEFDLSGTSAEFLSLDPFFPIRPYFAVPKIAHVCREMRQCAMQKYKFIGFRHPVTTINAEPVQDIAESAIWTDLPGESRIGFFDSAKDSIQIHLTSLHAVHLIQNAAVQCSDPFRAPTSTGNISTRKKKKNIRKTPERSSSFSYGKTVGFGKATGNPHGSGIESAQR
ncbi:hypothetical protein F4824DRAFT_441418 [Ustulina deusta]|nr:hypothetical protein F4824DRAFT_441418 [Ustulina deusta]